jgi:thioredoxin 1|tara:strand:+ start:479 stop:799 length:321 start_codon:yes stop_codon:yes gene_type:complete
MSTINVSTESFSTIVEASEIPVIVDFWAEWCGPCKMIAPTLEKLSQEYSGKILVAKVDIDANPDLTEKFNIRSIPTLLFMQAGSPIEMMVGAVNQEALEDKIKQLI